LDIYLSGVKWWVWWFKRSSPSAASNAYLSLSMPYAEDGTGIAPGAVDTPFRKKEEKNQ
jgi:hypothetical protein